MNTELSNFQKVGLIALLAIVLIIAAIVLPAGKPANNSGLPMTKIEGCKDCPGIFVTIINESIRNGHRMILRRGDQCQASYLGSFVPQRVADESVMILYNDPKGSLGFGTSCPSGTQFLLSEEDWLKLSINNKAHQQ